MTFPRARSPGWDDSQLLDKEWGQFLWDESNGAAAQLPVTPYPSPIPTWKSGKMGSAAEGMGNGDLGQFLWDESTGAAAQLPVTPYPSPVPTWKSGTMGSAAEEFTGELGVEWKEMVGSTGNEHQPFAWDFVPSQSMHPFPAHSRWLQFHTQLPCVFLSS